MKFIIIFLSSFLFGANYYFQAPISHHSILNSKYFSKTENKLTFKICGFHHRSEFRYKNEWNIFSKHIIRAEFQIFPMSEQKEFTFLQIHSTNKIDKPLLRIVWMKEYKGISDHIWAVIRLTPYKHIYKKIDLFMKPDKFFTISVKVDKNILYINGEKQNIKDWKNVKLYFKIGAYLQGEGCVKVLVKNINIT